MNDAEMLASSRGVGVSLSDRDEMPASLLSHVRDDAANAISRPPAGAAARHTHLLLAVLCCWSAERTSTVTMAAPSRTAAAADVAAVDEVYRKHWRPGLHNLAPGLPYWGPPAASIGALSRADLAARALHEYGDVHGAPGLVGAIERKLRAENGLDLTGRRVMVTAGANQAYVNALMATCSPGDAVLIFAPFYFTHRVAAQLLDIEPIVELTDPATLLPAPGAITRAAQQNGSRLKAVVLASPGNPSGAVIPESAMRLLVEEAESAALWLISDEAYEHFVFDGAAHWSPRGDHVINIFTMSKSYGMAGWRVGYMCYPDALDAALVKVQDTIPTHAAACSQLLAEAALDGAGSAWVRAQVATLEPVRAHMRAAVRDALGGSDGGSAAAAADAAGALYLFVPLPPAVDEDEAVGRLAEEFGVLVLPGASAGMRGYLRVSFASIAPGELAADASDRLRQGLAAIVRDSVS